MEEFNLPYPQQNYILAEYSALKSSLEEKMREIKRLKSALEHEENSARFLEMDLENKRYLLNLAKKRDKIYTMEQ